MPVFMIHERLVRRLFMSSMMGNFCYDKAVHMTMYWLRACFAGMIWFWLGICVTPLHAASLSYDVEIRAPESISTLLKQNLELMRWQGDKQIDALQLRRFYRNPSFTGDGGLLFTGCENGLAIARRSGETHRYQCRSR